MDKREKEKECCSNCLKKVSLVKYDYSQGGCVHADNEGFACMALAFEGVVVHMVGQDPDAGKCEMYSGISSAEPQPDCAWR